MQYSYIFQQVRQKHRFSEEIILHRSYNKLHLNIRLFCVNSLNLYITCHTGGM